MTIDHPLEVPIRNIGFGAVMIGEEPVAPAGAITLNVLGAVLDFDPSRPDLLPSCLVADPGIAVPVVEQLYGKAVADEVLNRSLQESLDVVSCVAVREPSLATLTRLAEVRWCQQNTAFPLDPSLLLLEELTLLAELRGIVDTDEDWVEELHGLLGALMARPNAVRAAVEQPAIEALIIKALEVLATESAWASEERDTATGWLHSLEGDDPRPAFPVSPFDWMSQLRPDLALAAGPSHLSGSSTVSWRDVPLGLMSRREGNVRWRVSLEDAEGAVTAKVEGTAGTFRLLGEAPTSQEGMFFDVVSAGWSVPLATGELTPDAECRDWSGKAAMVPEQVELLRRLSEDGARLDVRVRGAVPEPVMDPRVAAAERWCARAVCALRLRNLPTRKELLDSIQDCLERALDLWRMAGRRAELAATRELLALSQSEQGNWTEGLTVAETILVAQRHDGS